MFLRMVFVTMQKGEPMRLIDADTLMETLGITDTDCNKCAWIGEYDRCQRGFDFESACNAIENAPTIEPEQRKGEWIPKYNGRFTGGAYWFECSECGRVAPDIRNGGWNFCPKCGADMRGGQEEKEYVR